MIKKRVLSWSQPHEAIGGVMEGFNRSEGSAVEPKESSPAGGPEPVLFRRKRDTFTIRYSWKGSSRTIRIEEMHFSDQALRYLHQIDATDGSDSIAFTHSGFTYIARKATLNAARRLLASARKIKDCVSRIVAYFRTAAGNVYILSKVDKSAWNLSGEFSAPHIQAASWEDFSPEHRSRFAELATEMMVKLHRSGHIFTNPIPSEMMLDSKKAMVADPRFIKRSRKRTDAVDNFILMLRGLTRRGLGCSGTLFYCLSLYVSSMEKECALWYRKNRKSEPSDPFMIAQEIERRALA